MSILVDIEKTLGNFHLKVNFQARNETLALLGASGCGKSMTLKCIAGIEKPDRGRIVVDDTVLFDSEKKINLSPQQRHTGLLFQNYALFPNMTVLQNIHTGARREPDKAKRKANLEAVMESFGLRELSDRLPHQLSGGQQQRVALARILVSDPNILLLDEPFSALDAHLRFRLEQDMRKVIHDFGKTVLLVSHDRDEVFRMSDSIAVMDSGTIQALGEKHALFHAPQTRSGAVLTGCKNISPIRRLGNGKILATDWGLELEVPALGDDVTAIGIRMHDLSPTPGKNSFRFRVTEVIENPFSDTILLEPQGVPSPGRIGWETDKATWQTMKQDELTLSLPPEALLLLKDE